VAVFHDITELRRYENDLAVFAGVVAHDLKTPLTAVRGHCETAEEMLDAEAVDAARNALTRVSRAADRMTGMIDTLLAYTTARDAPLRSRTVDLGGLVREVLTDRAAADVHVDPLPAVRADPAMLRHVLENLIGNALKYVKPGDTAHVEVTSAAGPDGWTRIEVADRGIGIPDADKPAVFEHFHRAHAGAGYAGTGLGLAICKRIVERHGGEIGVADNPGGGTRFFFTIPEVPMSADRKDEDAEERLERALAERAAMADLVPGLPVGIQDPPATTEEPTPAPPAGPGRTA
jgi:signal transduction histidine kinase